MKNLKERYLELEMKKWNGDEKMVNFLAKNFFNGIDLKDGMMIFSKPSIEKYYCYSYDELRYETVDIAEKQCRNVRESFEAFLKENLKDIERRIKRFGEILKEENRGWDKAWIIEHYTDNDDITKSLKEWTINSDEEIKFRFKEGTYRIADMEEIKNILRVYIEMREYMIKRCKTYWKRYGGSKLRTWTYSMWD